MIVDDDVIIAEELKEILTIDGYDVVKTLYSAEEVLECAGTLRPDLILMDIGFSGGMDGIAAARKIKEDLGTPVMFFTGHSGIEIIERVKDLEPVGYVVKPFHEAQVTSNVRLAFSQIKIKKEMEDAHGRLQKGVRERTQRLAEANVKLKETATHLEEANTALRVLPIEWKRGQTELIALPEPSSRRSLAVPPLPSAGIWANDSNTSTGFTHRGLTRHKFTPVPGVHKRLNLTARMLN